MDLVRLNRPGLAGGKLQAVQTVPSLARQQYEALSLGQFSPIEWSTNDVNSIRLAAEMTKAHPHDLAPIAKRSLLFLRPLMLLAASPQCDAGKGLIEPLISLNIAFRRFGVDIDPGDVFTKICSSHAGVKFECTETQSKLGALIQRQLDAYNARDIETLMATYAEDAQQFEFPSLNLLASGRAAIRERFLVRFKEPNLHTRLIHRAVVGSTVIDHEEVTRTFPEGPGTIALVAIYEVREGRIAKAWFAASEARMAAS